MDDPHGEYDYDAVAESYGKLTHQQLALIEGYVYEYAGAIKAMTTIARAAHDAVHYGGHLLGNTIFLYPYMHEYATRPVPDESTKVSHSTIGVIRGFREDITVLPLDQQAGIRAQAQFTIAHYRSTSFDWNWVQWSTSSVSRSEDVITIADPVLRDLLNRHPDAVDRIHRIKEDSPEITSDALTAIIDGTIPQPLITGFL